MQVTALFAGAVLALALLSTSPDDGGCITDTECMEMHGGDGGPCPEDQACEDEEHGWEDEEEDLPPARTDI